MTQPTCSPPEQPIAPINILAHVSWHLQTTFSALNEEAEKVVKLLAEKKTWDRKAFEKMQGLVKRLDAGTLTTEQISNNPQGWELLDVPPAPPAQEE